MGEEAGATGLGHQDDLTKEGLESDLEGQVEKTGIGRHGVPNHGSEQHVEGPAIKQAKIVLRPWFRRMVPRSAALASPGAC